MKKQMKRAAAFLLTLAMVVMGVMTGNVKNVKAADDVSVSYMVHVQKDGWQEYRRDGAMSGTSGRSLRLEGICIRLNKEASVLGVQYTTHCQTYGWLPWSSNGEMSGTEGESKRLEAIKISLTGRDASKYDIFYRVHAQKYGWMNWAKNGEVAGTAGMSLRLEGIQIVVLPKGQTPGATVKDITNAQEKAYEYSTGDAQVTVPGQSFTNVLYRTHVQKDGWQGWRYNGSFSGTSGRSLRLEGICIKLSNQQYDGNINYRTHVQKVGWQDWCKNGDMAGTSGRSLRLEAIQIYLSGEISNKYDVYYRVHAQKFGWLNWVKNGEPAGTAGYGYRLEGIQVVLAEKGADAPGNLENIASSNSEGFIKKSNSDVPENPYYNEHPEDRPVVPTPTPTPTPTTTQMGEKREPTITQSTPVTITEEELNFFAAVVYCEAGGGGYDGKLAVANVVLNRYRAQIAAGKSTGLIDLLKIPNQFTVVSDDPESKFQKVLTQGTAAYPTLESCRQACIDACGGKNNIGDCDGFKMVGRMKPEELAYYYIIDDNIFFKW